MLIKKFTEFISEELVYGLQNLETGKMNNLLQLFSNDKSKIRQFLQSVMPIQKSNKTTKLKYLGGGGVGLTFEWIEPRQLEDGFENQNFTGSQDYSQDKNLIIKITANPDEAEKITQIIHDGGKKPGLARYYWIKKFELPDASMQYSTILKPPTYLFYDQGIKKKRIEEFIKSKISGIKWRAEKKRKKLTDEKALALAKAKFDKEIEKAKKKGGNKYSNLWVICLQKLEIPDERWKEILYYAQMYFHSADLSKYPASIITKIWMTDNMISRYWNYLQDEKSANWHRFDLHVDDKNKFKALNCSPEELNQAIHSIYTLYQQLSNLGPRSNKKLLHKLGLDLHNGNLGYDELGNLVAFDMWV